MRIAIDASRTTVPRITGTEQYALQMIRALLRLNTQHDITLYFRDPPSPDLFPDLAKRTTVRLKTTPLRRAWTHLRFARELWRDRPDMVWIPAHTLPFVFPGKAAATIHDLGYKYFPSAHPAKQRLYLDWTTRYSAARADMIFADSKATADDLTKFYGTDKRKIHVVYPGVDVPFIGDIQTVRTKYHLPERYFLFLGTLQPRKNIQGIVTAYQAWRSENPHDDAALVLAGGQGWLYDPAWIGEADNVILTGYVDDADKGALYAGALAFVFPTFYEGFGFPILEAMGCETPVLCSNTSSLVELAGDAALLVDPSNTDEIATAMTRITSDTDLREKLIERGRERVKTFTWDAAAQKILSVFEKASRQ